MPVLFQKWIERNDLVLNRRKAVYLFGDNTVRRGLGGQAKAMRGESNAIGIATKLTPTSGSNAFFSDDDFRENARIIAQDFRRAFKARDEGMIVVIPTDGLGTGLSELPTRAPRTNAFLEEMLSMLVRGAQPAWKELINGN